MNRNTLDITIKRMQELHDKQHKRAVSHYWKAGRNMVHMKREKNLLRKLGYSIKASYHRCRTRDHMTKTRLEPVRCYFGNFSE